MRKKLSQFEKRKIINKLRAILLKKKEIEFALVFGSFVSNIPFEDIDVGIYFYKDYLDKINKLDYIIELGIYLEEKIKGYEIDLVILNDLDYNFLYHIFKEGKLLFSRNKEKYYDFMIYVTENYLNYKEYRDYLIKEFLKS